MARQGWILIGAYEFDLIADFDGHSGRNEGNKAANPIRCNGCSQVTDICRADLRLKLRLSALHHILRLPSGQKAYHFPRSARLPRLERTILRGLGCRRGPSRNSIASLVQPKGSYYRTSG
jgi:hypothetical protein